ncbi:TetR/AcrR family transcriptional regulator [Niallia sp. XMNu-256]|uniref:TetR/AcrR family transcriptional regulator n=1 Tax=Niallia sp. XMNu-256 TaxID=3082444 RepID=UPI0030CF6E21
MTKKQLIMEKATELFAKQGFGATSIQQITDYCGISKGAFYLSFKSKDELIETLIDQFMIQIISDIDYIVNRSQNEQDILFDFYYTSYRFFQQHLDFARIFINEQMKSINEEVLTKFRSYNERIEKIIMTMIHRIYGEKVTECKFDLMYCIKGFLNLYSELFLYYNVPVDLHLLCQSLVEKTTLLAKHSRIPFMTEEMRLLLQPNNGKITKDYLLDLIEQKVNELEESIEKESLILLKNNLENHTYPPAIVKGLIENIRNHPNCKWFAYLLLQYYQF